MSRMERAGEVIRLSRGVYLLPDADMDPNHSLAEAAKRVPKCLVSAPAFHGLTDQLSPMVWMFETHAIEGVPVKNAALHPGSLADVIVAIGRFIMSHAIAAAKIGRSR